MSDYARELADKKLKALENKIKREYSKAVKEAKKKLDDYLKKFEKEDSDMQKKLLNGQMTKERYFSWRTEKLMATNEWQFTIDNLNNSFENAREIAAQMMTDHVKDIYALSHNYAEYEIEKGLMASLSFNLYDSETVSRLMIDNPKMLPNPGKKVAEDIKAGKVKRWNNKHIQSSMLQGILQGESLSMIAKRVSEAVGGMDERVAIRNARTMTTTAESAGRVDRYKKVQEMGIEMEQMWIATLDLHTRSSHRHLDGERVPVGQKFSNGLEYPGDLNGSPEEVYNCRCTIGAVIPGTDLDKLGIEGVQRNSRLGDMSYEDWKKERDRIQKESIPELDTIHFDNAESVAEYFRGDTYMSGLTGKMEIQPDPSKPATMWQNRLTGDQERCIADYTGNNYQPINDYLRGFITRKEANYDIIGDYTVSQYIKNIDAAINKYDLKEPITVYRTCEREFVDMLEVGSTFHDNGYGSTSVLSTPVASGDVFFEIQVPSGKGVGAYVDGLSWKEGEEFEFLLNRGANYHIVSKEVRNGKTYIKAIITGFTK